MKNLKDCRIEEVLNLTFASTRLVRLRQVTPPKRGVTRSSLTKNGKDLSEEGRAKFSAKENKKSKNERNPSSEGCRRRGGFYDELDTRTTQTIKCKKQQH